MYEVDYEGLSTGGSFLVGEKWKFREVSFTLSRVVVPLQVWVWKERNCSGASFFGVKATYNARY